MEVEIVVARLHHVAKSETDKISNSKCHKSQSTPNSEVTELVDKHAVEASEVGVSVVRLEGTSGGLNYL